MPTALHIARSGLDAQQTRLSVVSNNLANVSTTAFKKGRPAFEDLLYQTVNQPGANSSQSTELPSGLMLGLGVRTVATGKIFTQGSLQQTDNNLDMAIQGRGFFSVLMPDGSTAYSRDGTFSLNSQGQMVTSSGYTLDPSITIPAGLS
jgi:flagellar basal-body rod protein FlgG